MNVTVCVLIINAHTRALHAQLALFFFSVLLNLYAFLSVDFAVLTLYYCRKVPPLSKHLNALSALTFLAAELVFGVTPVLLALWNLPNPNHFIK